MTDPKYIDGDAFEKSLEPRLGALLKDTKNPVQLVASIVGLVGVAADVYKFTEAQETVRAEIIAKRDCILEQLRAQKEVMLVYLDKAFDERKANFESLFKRMDVAIAKNEIQQLAILADSINKLAASSPFKVLVDSKETMKALTDEKHEWNF